MKDKMVYKGDNVVGALMNVPIFVGTFSVISDFAILEDLHAYRDEGMGDVIIGEPFLREVGIKARRFEGMITLYKVLPGRQPGLLFNFIESVFPDIDTAYPLHAIRHIDCLDVISLYILCTFKTLSLVLSIRRIHEYDMAYPQTDPYLV
ncbi:hypothetical protein Tco_1406136 [Tanacetum coccineum]